MDYTNQEYPSCFKEKSSQFRYDYVFLFKPWKEIFISDNERYETFEESVIINTFLKKSYIEIGCTIIEVPFKTIGERADFILNWLKINA